MSHYFPVTKHLLYIIALHSRIFRRTREGVGVGVQDAGGGESED